MKSLEERKAERLRAHKEGPLGPQIVKDDGTEVEKEDDAFVEPVRNRFAGASKADPNAVAKVEGDDSIAGANNEVSAENASLASSAAVTATSTKKGSAAAANAPASGNGGGAGWKPNA